MTNEALKKYNKIRSRIIEINRIIERDSITAEDYIKLYKDELSELLKGMDKYIQTSAS